MAHQQDNVGEQACGAIVPRINICIPDKAMLIEDLHLPIQRQPKPANKKKGQLTWLMAAIALPTVGILLLLTLFLLAEPIEPRPHERVSEKLTRTLRNNIFIIDISDTGFPTPSKIAQLETVLKANQNNEIYQITLNRNRDLRNTTSFEKLKKQFKNFHYLYQNAGSYFKGSLFDVLAGSPREMLFKAQLLILWRYGGTVLATRWLTLKPLTTIQNRDKSLVIGAYNGQLSFMSAGNTCNAMVYEIMRELKKSGFTTEMEAIDRVILRSKRGIKKIDFPEICSNQTVNRQCMVMRSFEPDLPVNVVKTSEKAQGSRFYGYLSVVPTYVRRFFIFSP